jgi:pantoate--beta-alanine ligase
MVLFKKATDLSEQLRQIRAGGGKIGLVPTMGALHEGHLALIGASRAAHDITVCSIFVNPTQFNDAGDFAKYPVSTEADIYLLEKAGTDMLFLPSVQTLYPGGTQGLERYDLGELENVLEGKYRPGHFQGVCQVMHRLLDITAPDALFMGQKDYQQCLVINRLLKLTKINLDFRIIPTIREADGLAMSSRNRRLNEDQRSHATGIYKTLLFLKSRLKPGDLDPLLEEAWQLLVSDGFRTDYISIADEATLQPVHNWNGREPVVALIAAFQEQVRLIDNIRLSA